MAGTTLETADRLSAVIVEDDSTSRTLLRGILRRCNVDVVGESSLGRRGAELVQQLRPVIACLDIGLPDIDGAELLASIKAATPSVHVVMVTGVTASDRVRATLAAGAVGYIVKPYTEARVRSTLQRLFPGLELDRANA